MSNAQDRPTPTPPTKPAIVEGAADRRLEKDGAPKGYTYRLLKTNHPDLGPKGRIVTLTFDQARALKKGVAVVPTPAQIRQGTT